MSTSKISVSVGSVSFSGEGDQAWLTEQLEKVLKAAPGLAATAVRTETSSRRKSPDSVENETASFSTSLSAYIKEKGGESNQVDRFLISADWLRRRGNKQLTTAAVGKALVDNQQKRLANPADCLNKNVSKGFCEKNDGGFYITPEGLKKLEHE